MQPTRCSWYLP